MRIRRSWFHGSGKRATRARLRLADAWRRDRPFQIMTTGLVPMSHTYELVLKSREESGR